MLDIGNVMKRRNEDVEKRKGRAGMELEDRKFSLRTIPRQRGAAEQDDLRPLLIGSNGEGGRRRT